MTKKNYEMIAKAIVEARQKVILESNNNADVVGGANAGFYELAIILCNEFLMDNPKFEDSKFMVASEVLFN